MLVNSFKFVLVAAPLSNFVGFLEVVIASSVFLCFLLGAGNSLHFVSMVDGAVHLIRICILDFGYLIFLGDVPRSAT